MKPGDELELSIERDGADASAFVGSRRVHVDGALPGERVRARIVGRDKGAFVAKLLSVVEPSKDRVVPRCSYFGACGGCDWQMLTYAAQLDWKRCIVSDALDSLAVEPTIGCSREYEYRNKMEFSFGTARWLTDAEVASGEEFDRGFALGLFAPGRFDRVLDLKECHLQSSRSAALVNRIREIARELGLSAWNARKYTGFLRHLGIRAPRRGLTREGGDSREWMVNLVTSRHDEAALVPIAAMLRAEFPEVATFVNTINSGLAQVAYGDEVHVVFGAGVVHDHIDELVFEIGPQSFFQTNTEQAERLYSIVRDLAGAGRTDRVFDLFCGVGTISLSLARFVSRVIGIEIHEGAVENARRNAARNGVANAEFVAGDLLEVLPRVVEKEGSPDVIVLDPPRAGVHPKALRSIVDLRAERVVYVSCNPKTLGKDLQAFRDAYAITTVQPIDLFPQTRHVECVVALKRV